MSNTAEKTCATCHYRSDEFTSVCVNPDSEHRADFVMAGDTCPQYKEKKHERIEYDHSQFPDSL